MKMRQQKQYNLARMMFNHWRDSWDGTGFAGPMVLAFRQGMKEQRAETPQNVEEAKREFICVKVSDGSVVETFDLYEDADQLVHKHIRGKKAKLQIIDSLTGEVFVPA